jgi:ribosome maturation factor RimP
MITKQHIEELAQSKVEELDAFLVDVIINPGNQIFIELDKDKGVNIADCVALSRHIEHQLDRETEDFSLQVSSPGMGTPFKTERQYQKYLTKKVEVITTEGKKISGRLVAYSGNSVDIQEEPKVKKGAIPSKNKELPIHQIPREIIKETKAVISFK